MNHNNQTIIYDLQESIKECVQELVKTHSTTYLPKNKDLVEYIRSNLTFHPKIISAFCTVCGSYNHNYEIRDIIKKYIEFAITQRYRSSGHYYEKIEKSTEELETQEEEPPHSIEVSKIEKLENISRTVLNRCCFCGSEVNILKPKNEILVDIIPNNFLCNFCFKHGFQYEKKTKNVLILSFRSIVGYYYHVLKDTLCNIQLIDLIKAHERIGFKNPFFSYNQSNHLWFIDFNNINKEKHINDILKTIMEIIAVFQIPNFVKDINLYKFFIKYEESIREFYNIRKRPDKNKILSPTFYKTGVSEDIYDKVFHPYFQVTKTNIALSKKVNLQEFRNFILWDFVNEKRSYF